ncbi:hypothetical protein BO82DRAFT_370062 [Aspergillus uvarum CBS 121591]|uniref:Uncharacterized protein n=1 Tax=Aspergillus uvarum CBS 121591 TaxID=1448315 RepID=A0A319BSU7_9EURO|nr:hypothetical protein BO82DRAFT_370062 [Aspergillus uvarum CBS 121591]PYH75614.1 hypothetical protein BO82DRAFT_370062 [Aspergillus uvarum CBS 121591]
MGNNVDTKRVPSIRRLRTSAPCRDRRYVSRTQQKTEVAKRKDHEKSHVSVQLYTTSYVAAPTTHVLDYQTDEARQKIWSFASITFAFANYVLRQAPPELRSKVEDFAKASPGLLTMIQNGPQMDILPKGPDWLVAIQRHQVQKPAGRYLTFWPLG